MGVLLVAGLGVAGQAQETPVVPAPVRIEVDLHHPVGASKPAYAWFGYDEGNYTTMPHGRELLKELHDMSPAPVFVRAHHLLTSGDGTPELKWSSTGVYSEDAAGKAVYNFRILDGIFDAYRDEGVKPMVELGFMPKDLAAAGKDSAQVYQMHYPGNVLGGSSNNPPKDYVKWGELCRMVTAHLVARYGRAEVQGWYFEVWNEPDIQYFHGSEDEYLKLYDFAVAGVRAALPGARVGGPATTSPRGDKSYGYLAKFLDHVGSGVSAADGKAVPLDFISFHAKGSPSIREGVVTMGLNRELTDVDRGFGLIAKYARFKSLPIILSEADPEGCAACSSKVNPANNYRNGTLYPSYTAAAYKALFELQDRYGVNLLGMLSWSFEFEGKDYFEGFRSLATNGVDKPVLNVFRMFALMGGERVQTSSSGAVGLDALVKTGVREAPDVDAFATRSAHGAEVLVWNYHDVDGGGGPAATVVEVSGIPAKRVRAEEFRIDGTHSNAYTVWKSMGSPQSPTGEQLARLKRAGGLEHMAPAAEVAVVAGKVMLRAEMPAQAVSLWRLTW